MTSINTNLGAIYARSYAISAAKKQESGLTRLSSGLRINHSADDAAGWAVASKIKSQLQSMKVSSRNSMDAVSAIQTALSGMSEVTNMVIRVRELAVQMNNGVFSDVDRINAQLEARALLDEITKMSETTSFNELKLLDGTFRNIIRAGASNSEIIDLNIDGIGILSYIKGVSEGTLNFNQTILRPNAPAFGTSALNYLDLSQSNGSSVLDILESSIASGTSISKMASSSTAYGSAALKLLENVAPTGSSEFLTPNFSSGIGASAISLKSSVNASGSSNFLTPTLSTASGSSSVVFKDNTTAAGSSVSNYLSEDRALGTSTLTYLSSNEAFGSSTFLTPASSVGSGNSSLTIESNIVSTLKSSNDNSAQSTARGISERVILPTEDATGSSYLDYKNTTSGTGNSVVQGVPLNSTASITSASTLIPFSFTNGNFSSGGSGSAGAAGGQASIQGWDIFLNQVTLGQTNSALNNRIGGYLTPEDNNVPNGVGDDTALSQFDNTPIRYFYNAGSGRLTLGTDDANVTASGQMHGPYAVSKDPVELNSGDTVSFSWQALGNGDKADVFAYLLDVDTGNTITLLDQTASVRGSTQSQNVEKTISSGQQGNYKFVFVSGSFDADGGGKLGSSLSISNIQIAQADPSKNKNTEARVTIEAQESQSVFIETSSMGQLKSVMENNPGGYLSIANSGSDYWRFKLTDINNITSSALLRSVKSSYGFDLVYDRPDGGRHVEHVSLNLTTAQFANSILTAQEADTVQIEAGALNLLNSFASKNPGTYSLDPDSTDANKFSINSQTGKITSNSPLDFDVQKTYRFKVIYSVSGSSEKFVNEVELNLTDTLNSIANLSAEETDQLTIQPGTLTTIHNYSLEDNQGGNFRFGGGDHQKFNIDASTGEITSKAGQSILLAEQSNYSFDVIYRNKLGIEHTERVNLNIREALQATSNLVANDADIVTIPANEMTKVYGFAQRNSPGSYSFRPGSDDQSRFSIDPNTGTITSRQGQVGIEIKDTYNFGVTFTSASSGQTFTESINLTLTPPSIPLSIFSVTEANSISILLSDLSSTTDFVRNNGGGSFTLTGDDADKFEYDPVTSSIRSKPNSSLLIDRNNVYNFAKNYKFRLNYSSDTGNHSERIALTVNESTAGASNLTAHESGSVSISTAGMTDLVRFRARDRGQGYYRFSSANNDSTYFNIDQNTGTVTSKGELDFFVKPSYQFAIEYVAASDGRTFRQDVNLNLTDTLVSDANLSAEEALSMSISAATLSSTATYAFRNPGGRFSLSGTDSDKFNINELNGGISSKVGQNIIQSIKKTYNFKVNYTANGVTHTENVTLNASRAHQGTSTLYAQEADKINVFVDNLTKLSSFVSDDGNRGQFSFGASQGNDYQKFFINELGNISSRQALDFNEKSQYVFDVIYTGTSGTYTDTVTLNLTDTLSANGNFTVEESNKILIKGTDLTATQTYISENNVGSLSLSGADSDKFKIDNNGNISTRDGVQLREANQKNYIFTVEYDTGGDIHKETIELSLTEALQGSSSLSVEESKTIQIRSADLTSIKNFRQRHGAGTFFLRAITGINSSDKDAFEINSLTGLIQSKSELDFSDQSEYKFEVVFAAFDGASFTETVTLTLQDTLKSEAVLSAEEAEEVKINLNQLSSTSTYARRNPNGQFSLSGADQHKFDIAVDGTITSKAGQSLRKADQETYQFNVLYSANGIIHEEAVTLNLSEALQANSTVTAHEADQIEISLAQLGSIKNFSERRPGGFFEISSPNADANNFRINRSTGLIESNVALDYSDQVQYNLKVIYTDGLGTKFTETVLLNLTDTLFSKASLAAEEAKQLTINVDKLSSTYTYATLNPNGVYSLSGLDSDKFQISQNGTITGKAGQTFTRADQSSFQFNVDYFKDSAMHREAVTLNLTEALQSDANLKAKEAQKVEIPLTTLDKIFGFATRDNFDGDFFLDPSLADNAGFEIIDGQKIVSKATLEFDDKASYQLGIKYRAFDGRVFTSNVNLSLEETLQAEADLKAEQAQSISFSINELAATTAFKQKYTGGTFVLRGADALKFKLEGSEKIVSRQPLLIDDQLKYAFDLIYNAPNGLIHTESVELELTETLQSTATHTAQEASLVAISPNSLDYLYGFATRDKFAGKWAVMENKPDSSLFKITTTGSLNSIKPLNFNDQDKYEVGISYTTADGSKTFRQSVNLDLTDTVTAKSDLLVEEAEEIVISSDLFTATQQYIKDTSNAGKFRLIQAETDAVKFNIDPNEGTITSSGEVRKSNQSKYSFDVVYEQENAPTFRESVELTILDTTFNRSISKLEVKEAQNVRFSLDAMPNMRAFVENNSFDGVFSLENDSKASDAYRLFSISQTGEIVSNDEIDYEGLLDPSKPLEFRVKFVTNTGTTYREDIELTILNDFRDDNNLGLENLDISSSNGSAEAVLKLDLTLERMTNSQAKLGAIQNRIEHSLANLTMSIYGTSQAFGRIVDADFARETANLAKAQILSEAAMAMLAQANKVQFQVLDLI